MTGLYLKGKDLIEKILNKELDKESLSGGVEVCPICQDKLKLLSTNPVVDTLKCDNCKIKIKIIWESD